MTEEYDPIIQSLLTTIDPMRVWRTASAEPEAFANMIRETARCLAKSDHKGVVSWYWGEMLRNARQDPKIFAEPLCEAVHGALEDGQKVPHSVRQYVRDCAKKNLIGVPERASSKTLLGRLIRWSPFTKKDFTI